MKTIQNEHLTVGISTIGAEVKSIKGAQTSREYIWKADAAFWGKSSPLLFPVVGKLWNEEARINGKTYRIPKHGFMSAANFLVVEQSETAICLRATETAETLSLFPFPFTLEITYTLQGNRLSVEWNIKNTGTTQLPFQIGGHPGINYPSYSKDDEIKGYLYFGETDKISCATVGNTGNMVEERYTLESENGLTPITEELFGVDTVIIDREQVHFVTLQTKDRKPYVTLESRAPNLLIWSPYKQDAPFVCLEPWYGMPDAKNYAGEFASRPGTICLEPGENFHGGYTLTIHPEIDN